MICAHCGGRTLPRNEKHYKYRGILYELPEGFVYEYCNDCGAEWMTGQQIDVISDIIEKSHAQ